MKFSADKLEKTFDIAITSFETVYVDSDLRSGPQQKQISIWSVVATKFSNLREAPSVSVRYIRPAHTDSLPPFVRSGGFET
jgi:hypothetical protein